MQVLDDGQRALMAHGAAHVQLAVRPQRQVHLGVRHVAADIPLVVADGQHGSKRAAALELKRQAGSLPLQGVAHHGRGCQRAAQCRRGHRQRLMDLPCPLRQVPAVNGRRLHHAIAGDGPHDLVFHIMSTSLIQFRMQQKYTRCSSSRGWRSLASP